MDTLGRWMTHHLAELMSKVEQAEGEERERAAAQTSELILKIWENRRNLPCQADPLLTYQRAADVLAAIHPRTERFEILERFNKPTLASLSLELFDLASRVALLGLFDVLPERKRDIPSSVQERLSESEAAYLASIQGVYKLFSNNAGKKDDTEHENENNWRELDIMQSRRELLERLANRTTVLLAQINGHSRSV